MKLRPNLHEFLDDMASRYELIVYTASNKNYADAIIDYIEEKRKYFSYRLYNTQCISKPGIYTYKYLSLLCENRDIKDIILVDNRVRNYSLSIRNGIPIKEFKGDSEDYELIHLAKYMRLLASEPNICYKIKEDFAAFLVERSCAS